MTQHLFKQQVETWFSFSLSVFKVSPICTKLVTWFAFQCWKIRPASWIDSGASGCWGNGNLQNSTNKTKTKKRNNYQVNKYIIGNKISLQVVIFLVHFLQPVLQSLFVYVFTYLFTSLIFIVGSHVDANSARSETNQPSWSGSVNQYEMNYIWNWSPLLPYHVQRPLMSYFILYIICDKKGNGNPKLENLGVGS